MDKGGEVRWPFNGNGGSTEIVRAEGAWLHKSDGTRILDAAGATMANVVNMRVCLRDTADFPRFNAAFTAFMKGEKVTRTCIGGTPHRAGVNVEIDCVASFD